MNSKVVARLDDVWMSYPRWSQVISDQSKLMNPLRWPDLIGDGPAVLRGVSLDIRAGETVAIIGPNGAGKSTLLSVLGKVLRPRSGRVEIAGTVCPLLDREGGFNPYLTGRENALLFGVLLGARYAPLREQLDGIGAVSGLGAAFDAPLKTYSFGMTVRLSLAVALALEPDLLLMDDHALGDFRFRAVRREHLAQQRAKGAALVIVTHAMEAAVELCDEAIWLEAGRVKARGPIVEIFERYRQAAHHKTS